MTESYEMNRIIGTHGGTSTKIPSDGMSTEGCLVPSRRKIFDIFSTYCGTVITVPYCAFSRIISPETKRDALFYGASLSYYWEFLTVMNRASTNLVVSGFRKE